MTLPPDTPENLAAIREAISEAGKLMRATMHEHGRVFLIIATRADALPGTLQVVSNLESPEELESFTQYLAKEFRKKSPYRTAEIE